jgi:hypothetical protein
MNAEMRTSLKQYERVNRITLTGNEVKSFQRQFMKAVKDTGTDVHHAGRISSLRHSLNGIQPRAGIGFSTRNIDGMTEGVWGDISDSDNLGYYTTPGMDPDHTARVRYASSESVLRQVDEEIRQMRSSGAFSPTQINRAMGFRKSLEAKLRGGDPGVLGSIGGSIGRAMYMGSWINDEVLKGKILGNFMMGSMFDFKSSIWASGGIDHFGKVYTQAVGSKALGMKFFEGNDSRLGKMADAYYYWHPVNIAKGLFWDGRTWKKLSDLGLVSSALAERFAQILPGQIFSKYKSDFQTKVTKEYGRKVAELLKGPLAKLAEKYLGGKYKDLLALPLKKLITQIVQKGLTQILGSVIPGIGNVAALVADWAIKMAWKMGEWFLKPLLEIIVIIVLGGMSLFVLGIYGLGLFGRETLSQPYLSTPFYETTGHLVYGPIDFDFPGIMSGINCNQNLPDQNVQGILSKTEFGLLADRWTAGTNYADECYNDVICRALSTGVDPAFALAVWLHESGASNYDFAPGQVEDFGIHVGAPPEDFNAQANYFMSLRHGCSCTTISGALCWATNYQMGSGECDPDKPNKNGKSGRDFLKDMNHTYQMVVNNLSASLPSILKDSSRATGQLCVGTGGSSFPNSGGSSMPYGGSVLSGTVMEIWNQAAAEFGVNATLELVYPGSYWYEWLHEGAWCWSGSGTIFCKADKINGTSSAVLTGLFRHELAHQVQHSNGSLSNWSSPVREWGAEHLSGNGGNYSFYTSSGSCMRGLQVSQSLIDSGKCTSSQLNEIAKGKSLSGTACAGKVGSFITGATIGSSCN